MSTTEAGRLADQWGGEARDWASIIREIATDYKIREGEAVARVRAWIADALGPGDGVFRTLTDGHALWVPDAEEIVHALAQYRSARVWVALRVRLHLAGRDT